MCVMCILMNFCFSLGNLSFVSLIYMAPGREPKMGRGKIFFLLLHPIEISMVWLLSMSPQFLSLLSPKLLCPTFLEFSSFSPLMCLFPLESMRMLGSVEASLPPGSLPGLLAKSGHCYRLVPHHPTLTNLVICSGSGILLEGRDGLSYSLFSPLPTAPQQRQHLHIC